MSNTCLFFLLKSVFVLVCMNISFINDISKQGKGTFFGQISFNQDDSIEVRAIISAILDDDLRLIRLLLARGVDVNLKDKHGWTPLFHSVKRNNLTITSFLLGNGADPNTFSIDMQSVKRITPLHLATAQGNLDITKLLLAYGADVNANGDNGNTPLHRAAEDSNNSVIVQELISQGANVNAKNSKGRTPLMLCCHEPKMIDLLAKNGGVVDEKDIYGKTAIHYASYYRCYKAVRALLANGADPKIKDQKGESALDIAKQRKDKQLNMIFRGR